MRIGKKQMVSFFFLFMIIVPILFINRIPNKVSELEKRNLTIFPAFFTSNGKLAPNIRQSLENWLNDNIGFRDIFVSTYGNIQYKILGNSPNPRVEIGRDGWFYYTWDRNIQIASGEYVLSDVELEAILYQQTRINSKLKAQGVEYVLILPASKVSIYPEYIRSGDYSPRKTPVDQVSEYIQKYSDIKVIPFKEALLQAKNEEQVFFKTDTHWNENGAYIAYREMITKLSEFSLIKDMPIEVVFEPSTYLGEMSGLMGNAKLLQPENTLKSVIINPNAHLVETGELYQAFRAILDRFQVWNPCYLYENSTKNTTLLMFGDSMFAGYNVTQLLAEHFNNLIYVWGGDIQQEYIDLFHPDIVAYELTERYLDKLVNKNRYFTDKLDDFNAEIIFHNTPTTIKTGQSYDIDITVQNTSSEVWNESKQVRLCIWRDGVDHGYRVYLPTNLDISPGETYTFTLKGLKEFNESNIANFYLEYQMCQEGITYFGERERIDIAVEK